MRVALVFLVHILDGVRKGVYHLILVPQRNTPSCAGGEAVAEFWMIQKVTEGETDGGRVPFRHYKAILSVDHQPARRRADRIGRDNRNALVEGLVDNESPGFLPSLPRDGGKDECVRCGIIGNRIGRRDIAWKSDTVPNPEFADEVLTRLAFRTSAQQDETGVAPWTDFREGANEVVKTFDGDQPAYRKNESHIGWDREALPQRLYLAGRNRPRVEAVRHGVFAGKDLMRVDTMVDEIASDVMSISHNCIGMAIDTIVKTRETTVRGRIDYTPIAGPHNQRASPGEADREDRGQSKLAVDALDDNIAIVHPRKRYKLRNYANASDSEAAEILVRDMADGYPVLRQPVCLATIGIEQESRIVSLGN